MVGAVCGRNGFRLNIIYADLIVPLYVSLHSQGNSPRTVHLVVEMFLGIFCFILFHRVCIVLFFGGLCNRDKSKV